MVEALKKFNEFEPATGTDRATKKSGIKDVFTTVMRTAIIYDDEDNTNWHKMWDLLQVNRLIIDVLPTKSNTILLNHYLYCLFETIDWSLEDEYDISQYEYKVNNLQESDWEADQRIYIAALARAKDETILRK